MENLYFLDIGRMGSNEAPKDYDLPAEGYVDEIFDRFLHPQGVRCYHNTGRWQFFNQDRATYIQSLKGACLSSSIIGALVRDCGDTQSVTWLCIEEDFTKIPPWVCITHTNGK